LVFHARTRRPDRAIAAATGNASSPARPRQRRIDEDTDLVKLESDGQPVLSRLARRRIQALFSSAHGAAIASVANLSASADRSNVWIVHLRLISHLMLIVFPLKSPL